MTPVVSFTGFLVAFAWVSLSNALYFHIGETEKKCFIEEIPDETMVIGRFSHHFRLSGANVNSSCSISYLARVISGPSYCNVS